MSNSPDRILNYFYKSSAMFFNNTAFFRDSGCFVFSGLWYNKWVFAAVSTVILHRNVYVLTVSSLKLLNCSVFIENPCFG